MPRNKVPGPEMGVVDAHREGLRAHIQFRSDGEEQKHIYGPSRATEHEAQKDLDRIRAAGSLGTTREEGLTTRGTFTIDSTLGRDTLFGIIVDDVEDHFIKSVTFNDSAGVVYGPYSTLTNDYNVINIKTINFPKNIRTKTPPFDDVSC